MGATFGASNFFIFKISFIFNKLKEMFMRHPLRQTFFHRSAKKSAKLKALWTFRILERCTFEKGETLYNINADVKGWRAKKGRPLKLTSGLKCWGIRVAHTGRGRGPSCGFHSGRGRRGRQPACGRYGRAFPRLFDRPGPPALPRLTPDETRRRKRRRRHESCFPPLKKLTDTTNCQIENKNISFTRIFQPRRLLIDNSGWNAYNLTLFGVQHVNRTHGPMPRVLNVAAAPFLNCP